MTKRMQKSWEKRIKQTTNLLQLHTEYWEHIIRDEGPTWARPWMWGWCLKHYANLLNNYTIKKREKEEIYPKENFTRETWWTW